MKGLGAIIGVIIFCLVIYGAYWVVKNICYAIFYEDLVEQTICVEVKKEFLINPKKCD